MITAEEIRQFLNYDPNTGHFRWKARVANHTKIGTTAGSKNSKGYEQIRLRRRNYAAHRLALLYVYGDWPSGQIDHINLDPLDNRITNLRLATPSQNTANQRKRNGTSSRFKGVTKHRQMSKWQAQIKLLGKNHYLGLFDSEEAAYAAYCKAAIEIYGPFARLA